MRPEDERWLQAFRWAAQTYRGLTRPAVCWPYIQPTMRSLLAEARLADAQARIRELEAEVERLRRPHPAAREQPEQQTVTTHLRQHAETYASVAGTQGRYPTPPEGYPESTGWWQDALRRSQAREESLARVRTQFLVGALRYGMPEPGRAARWDWIGRIEQEVVRYRATGEPGCLTEILACALGEYADRGFHLQRWEGRGDDGLKTQEVEP